MVKEIIMTNRLLIFLLLILTPLHVHASLNRLSERCSLMLVLDMIYTASYDFDRTYRIEEREFVELVDVKCQNVKSSFLKEHINSIFEVYQSYYPDDDLPFDKAREELDDVVSQQEYLKCSKEYANSWESVETDHYRPLEGGYWITIEHRSFL